MDDSGMVLNKKWEETLMWAVFEKFNKATTIGTRGN
jgi:hypothetical protein